jgi:thiol-disulfide isomerase/thioredoxin/uncharacterized membrane protein YphA (DoxX/SURF4 family)
MSLSILIVRLLLAGTWLLAAVTKITDRDGARRAVEDFGTPSVLVTPLTVLLPLGELIIAALLVPGRTAPYGAILSFLLLLGYCAAIGVNMARGNRPDCHCFGQLYSEPIGWQTLARNGVLAAASLFLLADGFSNGDGSAFHTLAQVSGVEWIAAVTAVVLLVSVGVLIRLVMRLLEQSNQLITRIKFLEAGGLAAGPAAAATGTEKEERGLPVGSPAPDFLLPDLSGNEVTLESLTEFGKAIFVVFASPSCGPCAQIIPDVLQWQQKYEKHLEVVIVTNGPLAANREKFKDFDPARVLLQQGREVEEEFEVRGTPSAVLIHPDGSIASPVAEGIDTVRYLLRRFLDLLLPPPLQLDIRTDTQPPRMSETEYEPLTPRVAKGEELPSIVLQTLSGTPLDLSELRGERTAIMMYSTSCSWCAQMLPELKEWDADQPAGAPRLVVVATGPEEQVREQIGDLQSIVLHDKQSDTGNLLDLPGTPMAVLLDAEGKVVLRAAGLDQINHLLNGVEESEAIAQRA